MKCYKCGKNKPEKEFGKAQLQRSVRNRICRICDTERAKTYNHKRTEEKKFDMQFFKFVG